MKRKTLIYHVAPGLFAVAPLVLGCHFFEDPDNLDECPLNSGYPCPCDPNHNEGYCADSSTCIYYNDQQRGFCSKRCTGVAEETVCESTRGYGAFGFCRAILNQEGVLDQCMVACKYDTMEGGCPPGLECYPFVDEDVSYSACVPIKISKSSTTVSCGDFCGKFINCAVEFGVYSEDYTYEDCEQECQNDGWADDECMQCWLKCDVSTDCNSFFVCLDSCGCQ